jgi:hypothetical protein
MNNELVMQVEAEDIENMEPPLKNPRIRTVNRLAFAPPNAKDGAMNTRLLLQPRRAITIFVCNDCGIKGPARIHTSEMIEKSILELELCPTCCNANKRIAHAIHYNISAKDEHDDFADAHAKLNGKS